MKSNCAILFEDHEGRIEPNMFRAYTVLPVEKDDELTISYGASIGHEDTAAHGIVCQCGSDLDTRQRRYTISASIVRAFSEKDVLGCMIRTMYLNKPGEWWTTYLHRLLTKGYICSDRGIHMIPPATEEVLREEQRYFQEKYLTRNPRRHVNYLFG